MKTPFCTGALLVFLTLPCGAQISGNNPGNVSGNIPGNIPGGFSAGERYVPNESGGLVSRDRGSARGYVPDGRGGLVGTGENAGKRCLPAGGDNYRCY